MGTPDAARRAPVKRPPEQPRHHDHSTGTRGWQGLLARLDGVLGLAAVEELGSQHLACAICGRPDTEHVGVFAPTDANLQRIVGTPAGKLRLLLYPVCDMCAESASLEVRERAALRFMHVTLQRGPAGLQ